MNIKRTLLVLVTILMITVPLFETIKSDGGLKPRENSPIINEPTWTYDTESDDIYPYLTDYGKLYLLDQKHDKLMLMNDKGFKKWEQTFENNLTHMNNFSRKHIYITTRNETDNEFRLYKLETSDGSKLWSHDLGEENVQDVIVDNKNQIYFSTYNSEIIKLDDQQDVLWNISIGDGPHCMSTRLDGNDNLYVLTKPNNLYCFDSKGKKLWEKDVNSISETEEYGTKIQVYNNNIYLFTNRSVYRLGDEGNTKNKFRTENGEISSLSFKKDDKFYILKFKQNFSSIKAVDGEGVEKWKHELTSKDNKTNIMIGLSQNDRIYCQFFNFTTSVNIYKILCFEEDGTPAWKQVYHEGNRSFHLISEKGTIYFAKENGTVYAYQGQPGDVDKYSKWTAYVGIGIALFILILLIMGANKVWKRVSEEVEEDKDEKEVRKF